MHSRPPIRALLLDLSGTLHVGSTPTTHATHALAHLRTHNAQHTTARIPYRFCSNTSKEGRTELEHRLRTIGFELNAPAADEVEQGRELWTSLGALTSELRRQRLSNPYCLLEHAARSEVLRDLGVLSDPHSKPTRP